jgi:5'-methylthioinosine phosphorylase
MLAIIGGTGLNRFDGFTEERTEQVATDFSDAPVRIFCGSAGGHPLCFLPRHGEGHTVPPHLINYRANIQALHRLGASAVLAVNAVGGIHPEFGLGDIAVPNQVIDYSWGREHTFCNGGSTVEHIDFTYPYDEDLRQRLLQIASQAGLDVWARGVYGCTQGPRLETAAEVQRLKRDGCDMIGMTGMPEAALARELNLPYVCLALSVNWAAGLTDEIITMESIESVLREGMHRIHSILSRAPAGLLRAEPV